MFNAPLKVLITYVAEGAETESLLGKYEAVIREADVFNDISTLRKQLVVIGTPQAVREWRFYVYESDGFVLMAAGLRAADRVRPAQVGPAGGRIPEMDLSRRRASRAARS